VHHSQLPVLVCFGNDGVVSCLIHTVGFDDQLDIVGAVSNSISYPLLGLGWIIYQVGGRPRAACVLLGEVAMSPEVKIFVSPTWCLKEMQSDTGLQAILKTVVIP
jgi:hypothetical protein